jgi:NADH-quinone oxidoreductase subunit H
MAKGPWTILGPAAPSQTPEAIKKRYINSVLVLLAIFGPILLLTIGVQVKFGEVGVLLAQAHEALSAFAAKHGVPAWAPVAMGFLVPCFLLNLLFQLVPAALVWWEQKIAAHVQVRMGPMKVGRFHGILQTVADGIKLLLKEDIVPAGADKWVHWLAPVIVAAPAYVCYAVLPLGKGLAAVDLDIGTLFVMAVSGLSTVGLLMAGWGSNSKYSVLGGLRAAAQMVSYEIPRVIALLPVVMWAGTLSLSGIAAAQTGVWGGFLPKWFIFYPVVGQIGYIIFLICTVAETNRVPFDVAEAESELVSGFNTEYSGMKFALFFLAEYAYVFLGAGIGTVLFLGGGNAPWKALDFIPSYMWFLAKTLFQIFFIILFRWTYPRLRVDRLMEFCWKFLLPWSLVNVVLAGALILWRMR